MTRFILLWHFIVVVVVGCSNTSTSSRWILFGDYGGDVFRDVVFVVGGCRPFGGNHCLATMLCRNHFPGTSPFIIVSFTLRSIVTYYPCYDNSSLYNVDNNRVIHVLLSAPLVSVSYTSGGSYWWVIRVVKSTSPEIPRSDVYVFPNHVLVLDLMFGILLLIGKGIIHV